MQPQQICFRCFVVVVSYFIIFVRLIVSYCIIMLSCQMQAILAKFMFTFLIRYILFLFSFTGGSGLRLNDGFDVKLEIVG